MVPPSPATSDFLARFSRRRMWARALLWNAIGWAAGLATFFATQEAIIALLVLAVVVLGGFVWDVRRTVRLIVVVRRVREAHPEWEIERVLQEVRRLRPRKER